MFDQNYFDKVLPDQVQLIGQRVRVTVHLQSGPVFDVRSLLSAHELYAVFEVQSAGDTPKRTKEWQTAHPAMPPWIFDQVTVPYSNINAVYLTAHLQEPTDGAPSGFNRPGRHG